LPDTIFVTGAGGYIGSILVDELLTHGYNVIAYDRFYFGQSVLDKHRGNERLKLVKKDIRDAELSDFNGVSVVCDLAALSNDPSGEIDPALTIAVNHKGRSQICSLAKQAGVRRYILSSSCSVYGAAEGASLVETSRTAPLTTYARANRDAELDTLAKGDESFSVTVLRNATVFGLSPRMRFDLVINIMTLHAAEKGMITIMGGGRQWRPLVHVRDVARMFRAVVEADRSRVSGEIFNVGLANFQIRSLAFIVRETLPIPVTISVAPDDPDRRDYSASFEKAKDRLGFTAVTTIEEGVREIYDALKYGTIEESAKTSTVKWYRNILDAKQLLDEIEFNGRIL
jgi:nucleoside-diphosphate-sugar epimerase